MSLLRLLFLGLVLIQSSKSNDLNIPDPLEVPKENAAKYSAYNYFAQLLAQSSELTASPCNKFYEYTCQNLNVSSNLDLMADLNLQAQLAGLRKSPEGQPEWYRRVKGYFDKCVERTNKTPLHQNGKALQRIFNKVRTEVGVAFPLVDGANAVTLSPAKLGEFVGYLAQKFELHTFVEYEIERNSVHLKEPRLAFPLSYYIGSFDQFERDYKALIVDYVEQLAKVFGKYIHAEELVKMVDEVVRFEKELAELLSHVSDETPALIQDEKWLRSPKSIDVDTYLRTITKNMKQPYELLVNNVQIYLTSPTKTLSVDSFLAETDPATVANYLYIRLARSLRKYFLRKPKDCVADHWLRQGKGIKFTGLLPPVPERDDFEIDDSERRCLRALSRFWHAHDRIYLDERFPDKKERSKFVDRIKIIANKVIQGLKFQMDQVSWLRPKAKEAALRKIDGVTYNLGYDDWIEDDDRLNLYYKDCDWPSDDDEFTVFEKLRDCTQRNHWQGLFDKSQGHNFTYSIIAVNALYMSFQNRFYIPLGIIQRPIFDINYPTSMQYGGIGYIIGHELNHGFGPGNINVDENGKRNPWMDNASQAKYNEMKTCVIDEYNKIHGDGAATVDEDIPDNSGLRSSFNAYKAEQGLYGLDPQLPRHPLNKFTQDQLFFLTFASTWCSQNPNRIVLNHSNSAARVYGTLQNMPAFRAAFNCPVGSVYAPKEHCDVWASEVQV